MTARETGVLSGTEFEPFLIEATERSIPARFEYQAHRHPDRVAIQTRSQRLTYRELNASANRIARAVYSARGAPSEPVALLIGDDATMIAALLGVLKTGNIFVLLDPSQPDARTAQVLQDSGAGLVVTDSGLTSRARALTKKGVDLLDINMIDPSQPNDDLGLPLAGDTHAIIVYTSGSTGRPKGVLQNHRNILHNALVHTNTLRISPRDRLTLLSARTTGQAMTGIFSALLNGAELHPFDIRKEGLAALADWLFEERITLYHSSASVFRQLAEGLTGDRTFPEVRVVKLGSEPVSKRDLERVREIFPRECIFVNALSSSETWTILQNIIAHDTPLPGGVVPVGYPVPDVEVLLLDDQSEPVEPGQEGTICVRSRYLTPGYWRDPESTRAAFLPDREGNRLFRTGDLGRLASDGSLVYLGREDFRVKIRGHRVEVAEVEAAVREFAGVAQTVVAGQDDGRGATRLVAYVVPESNAPAPTPAELRAFVRTRLPAHMVPTGFMFLDALPLTPGLKVDRRALPSWQPFSHGVETDRSRKSLRVTQLMAIWEQLLGVPDIDSDDDFFELGGDSLLAVEMVVKVEEAFGKQVQLQDFVPELTIEKLARAIADDGNAAFHNPLVTLRATGSKRPFILVHGDLECGGFYARNLARYLDPDRPFYVLHPHGLDGRPVPSTIEEMAADRMKTLADVGPRGPYVLGGFCCGGVVAVEMSRQFQTRGESADIVILIDARAENAPFRAWIKSARVLAGMLRLEPKARRRLYHRVRTFLGAFREDARELASMLRLEPEARRRVYHRVRTFLDAFREESRRGAAPAMRFVLKKPFAMIARRCEGPSHAQPDEADNPSENYRILWTSHHDVLKEYVPDPLPVRIVLLRSSHLDYKEPRDEAAGWRDVAREVEVHWIPGDHKTCVTRHVETLAREIDACLADSQGPVNSRKAPWRHECSCSFRDIPRSCRPT
jgi:amino acid adenylation domain-containing protein